MIRQSVVPRHSAQPCVVTQNLITFVGRVRQGHHHLQMLVLKRTSRSTVGSVTSANGLIGTLPINYWTDESIFLHGAPSETTTHENNSYIDRDEPHVLHREMANDGKQHILEL